MAPTAQTPYPEIVTLIHTKHLPETTASKHKGPSTRIASRPQTRTKTRTIISTITLGEPSATSILSPFEQQCTTSLEPSNTNPEFTIPTIHGIVPGPPRIRHSLPLSPSQLQLQPTLPTTIATIAHTHPYEVSTAVYRFSKYPRPSPPGFLYSSAIVPPAAYAAQQRHNLLSRPEDMQHDGQPHHSTSLGSVDYELSYLPSELKILFIGVLAITTLAFLWAILVWLVNFPPGSWSYWQIREQKELRKGKERRPLDKPSKYAPIPCVSPSTCSPANSATTSALYTSCEYGRLDNGRGREMRELTHRPQHKITDHQPSTTHNRPSSPPSTNPHFPLPSSQTLSSPPNPFLDPPKAHCNLSQDTCTPNPDLKPRSSNEWLTERAAFFANNNPLSRPISTTIAPALHHHTPCSSPSSYSLNTSAIEALEAGTARLTDYTSSRAGENADADMGVLKKSLSWLDQGLGMVDGAVGRVAGGIAKWTDDDGGEEGVLLPVAIGKGAKDE